MHKLEISCTVKKPDGSEFYHELHRWHGVDDVMMVWFTTELSEFLDKVKKEKGGKEDGSNFSGVFSMSVDDAAVPDELVDGVSYHGLVKLEREWHKLSDKLIKEGEKRAQHKK